VSLASGMRIGVYEIAGSLGAGGMGEVYRARDTRLQRDVALKVLPDAFAQDPDRVARFAREAQLLASLSHPNIAAIHGIEDAPIGCALVLELIEGPTLAERITRAPLHLADTLAIARQIVDALDAAHEKGIVHRDLKPANVKVTPAGLVKVLDFGLAKAVGNGSTTDLATSPTMTTGGTRDGVILGTAAYMSPEQARGRAVDKRTDIWAFGCVLYEMLTRRAAFPGHTVADTIAGILEREPDWGALPASTPRRVRDLLRHCLQKDPKQRLRDAGDAVNEITVLLSAPSVGDGAATPALVQPSWRRSAALMTAALIFGGLISGGFVWMTKPSVSFPPPRLVRFALTSDDADALEPSGLGRDLAISPDGTRVVYVAGGPGRGRLVIRTLAQLDATPLWDRGTPRSPFFSPDGQWVAFFDLFGSLKKISTTGGPATEVTRGVGGAARGASWGADDRIVFATGDPATGLSRVSAQGGDVEVLTRPDTAHGEVDHLWPEVLPGGRAALFTIVSTGSIDSSQIAVLDLRTGTRKVIIRGGTHAQYVPSGHLIYGAAGSLHALRFDLDRLDVTGESVKVAEPVAITAEGGVNGAVSPDGTLVYVRSGGQGTTTTRELVWVSRDGHEEPIAAPPRAYVYPRISPDGTRVALEVWDEDRDIWVWNLARETLTRLTDNPGRDGFPVWTRDSQRIIFGSARSAFTNLFWRHADGSGSVDRLTESRNVQFPYSVSPDGTRLVLREDNPQTGLDIAIASLTGELQTAPLIRTPSNELNGEISPDSRWLAYQSNESGHDEIYVRPFPDVGRGQWQVSTAGGTRPSWARNGRELFYLAPDGLNLVTVAAGNTFSASRPTRLIEHHYFAETAFIGRTYDVSPDGLRFLMIKAGGSAGKPAARSPIIVVDGWFEELKRAVPLN
jgi:Tol biopolymer transport system component